MFMRFQGGRVGHNSTRDATDWFLQDHDRLDTECINDDDGSSSGEETRSHSENDGNEDSDGMEHLGDDVEGDNEEQGLLDDGFGGLNEDDDNSEPEPNLADDALGPEDGEEEGDGCIYLALQLCSARTSF